MGDLRPEGNGVPPDDGGSHRDELPDFPPEWGPVIIPDDASELDDEAQALRRELRRHARQSTLRSALGLHGSQAVRFGPAHRREAPTVGVPVVIMAVAILTTLVSLFVVTWSHQTGGTSGVPSPTGPAPAPVTTTPTAIITTAGLVDATLTDAAGQPIRVGSLLPAVVLLVDQCDCATLVPQLAAAAPAGVTIVPVAQVATTTTPANIHALADPKGPLRALLTDQAHPTPPAAVAVLLDRTGGVVAAKPTVLTATELLPDLAKLAA